MVTTTQIDTISQAIIMLFRTLEPPQKRSLLSQLRTEVSEPNTKVNPQLIASINSGISYKFTLEEFEEVSNNLLNDQPIDFNTFKQVN